MILNQAQAEAVYSAMCALRSIAAIEDGISLRVPLVINGDYEWVKIDETDRDVIRVAVAHANREEHHAGQDAFATAYGLNSGAAPAVCGECGGRGEVETGIGMMTCASCTA